MTKNFKKSAILILIGFLLAVSLALVAYGQPLASVMIFDGIVKINGKNASDGTIVRAYMQNDMGVLVERNNTSTTNGYYALSVNGNQSDNNKTINFTINDRDADQTAIFNVSGGVPVVVHLSLTTRVRAYPVAISEVYYDESVTGHTEFVELYNPTSSSVNLAGWKIQYKTATGTSWSPKGTISSGTIPAHGYYLEGENDVSTTFGVGPDKIFNSLNMANNGGHIRILNSSGDVIDVFGWGTADSPERQAGVDAPAGSSSERKSGLTHYEGEGNGWDTNNNFADFFISTPNPQNSSNNTETTKHWTVGKDGWQDFTKIQDAINNATSGDTISVYAGTYNERLTVDKTVSVVSSGSSADTSIKADAGGVFIDVRANADNFNLSGFNLIPHSATTFVVQLANTPSNVTIENNVINTTGGASQGVSVGAAGADSLTIKDNTFYLEAGDGGIWAPSISNTLIDNNVFYGGGTSSGYAIEVSGADNTIISNNFVNSSSLAIAVLNGDGSTNVYLTANTVNNSKYGIFVTEYGAGTLNDLNATYNTFNNNIYGTRVTFSNKYNAASFKFNFNNYIDNTNGLANEDANSVNATYNYWNHPTGPGGAAGSGLGDNVTANVTFYPWYIDSGLTTLADATTSHSSTIEDKTIANLTQDNQTIQIRVSLNNTGSVSAPMYDAHITVNSIQSNFASPSPLFESCGTIPAGSSCTKTFDMEVKGGTTSNIYHVNWKFNWTNNDGTIEPPWTATSTVTILGNYEITVPVNITETINHGVNSSISTKINSTGNAPLNNVVISYTPTNLLSGWVSFSPSSVSSIAAGSNEPLGIWVAIPKGTTSGNYTGTFTISAASAASKQILLKVEVPTDESWTSYPSRIDTFRKTNVAGTVGTVYINNSGNVDQSYTISYSGKIRTYSGLWDTSNPTSINVPKQNVSSFDANHLGYWLTGSYDLNVTLTADSKTNSTIMNLTLENDNPTLNITNPINNTFVKGIVDFNVNASDLNLSHIEFFIDNNLVFTDADINETFKWDTTNGSYDDGEYSLKATAFDSAGNFNSSPEIFVTVNNTANAPVFTGTIGPLTWEEDTSNTVNLSQYFSSLDGSDLKYNFTQVDNISISIDNSTGIATLSPDPDFYGVRNVVFYGLEPTGLSTPSNNVDLTVTNVNDVPSTPTLLLPIDGAVVFTATGKVALNWTKSTDADNDPLTYNLFYGNDTDVTSTAATSNNYLTLLNLENGTTYYWKVNADDGLNKSGNSTLNKFTVTFDDEPKVINFTPSDLTPTVAENSTLVFVINATDPDSGLLNYSWFLDGALNKTDGNNLTYAPDFDDAGTHTVFANITDNNSNTVTSPLWTVTVLNTNRAPVLDAVSDKSVDEDSELKFNVTASDPDGDSLSFTSNISSITFTNAANNSMATVSWTPTNDDIGNNTVEINVSDGSSKDSEVFTIEVQNVNDAPVLNPIGDLIAPVDILFTYDVDATDVDAGDVLKFYSNSTIFDINETTGLINFTPSGSDIGEHTIEVKVNDTAGSSDTEIIKFTVTDEILSDELTSNVQGLNQSERQNATNIWIEHPTWRRIDFGNNVMNFSGVALLEDVLNISLGFISVDTNQFPNLTNSSIVMDGLNYTKAPWIFNTSGFGTTAGGNLCPDSLCMNKTYDKVNGVLTFNVAHFTTYYTTTNTTNGAPTITSTPVTGASTGVEYRYNVVAEDPDADPLTFSLLVNPTGMSIGTSSGSITWTPTSSDMGSHAVIVEVSDSSLTDSQSFEINVSEGPKLIISDLDIKVNGKSDKNVHNNSRIKKEVAPGDKIEFKIEIENRFTKEEDLEIEDIEVEIIIEDIDDRDDLEEEAKEFDLDPEKDKTVDIDFNIPLLVEEGDYDVIINVEGKDENGTTHEIRWELELEVEKEKHALVIRKVTLNPSTLSCSRTSTLNFEVVNIGRDEEEEVAVEVLSQEIGLNFRQGNIELEEGDDADDVAYNKRLTINVPENQEQGTYTININAFYDTTKLDATESIELNVQDCERVKKVKEPVKEEKPDKDEVDVIRPPGVEEQPPAPVTRISFRDSNSYLIFLATTFILLSGLAIFTIGAAVVYSKK